MDSVDGLLVEHIRQHSHDIRFAVPIVPAQRRLAVSRGISLPGGQAAIALTCDPRGFRVDFFQILQHRADRRVETVKVEPIDRHRLLICGPALLPCSQSMNDRTSLFRHIHVGKRANAVHSEADIRNAARSDPDALHRANPPRWPQSEIPCALSTPARCARASGRTQRCRAKLLRAARLSRRRSAPGAGRGPPIRSN